jgi:hypothetical protein
MTQDLAARGQASQPVERSPAASNRLPQSATDVLDHREWHRVFTTAIARRYNLAFNDRPETQKKEFRITENRPLESNPGFTRR